MSELPVTEKPQLIVGRHSVLLSAFDLYIGAHPEAVAAAFDEYNQNPGSSLDAAWAEEESNLVTSALKLVVEVFGSGEIRNTSYDDATEDAIDRDESILSLLERIGTSASKTEEVVSRINRERFGIFIARVLEFKHARSNDSDLVA